MAATLQLGPSRFLKLSRCDFFDQSPPGCLRSLPPLLFFLDPLPDSLLPKIEQYPLSMTFSLLSTALLPLCVFFRIVFPSVGMEAVIRADCNLCQRVSLSVTPASMKLNAVPLPLQIVFLPEEESWKSFHLFTLFFALVCSVFTSACDAPSPSPPAPLLAFFDRGAH